jgi:IS605 OrfB family transposase
LRWRVTGVYKEESVPKFKLNPEKRIGIDQNAGFITAACVDGRRLLWVRKFKISQKGTTEEHEARIHAVSKKISALAEKEQAVIVLEDLRLADKHKEFSSKRVRRHIQRIPYRKFQEILGRVCSRTGATLRMVNPAYTSILGRYRLPGMQVHLAAAAMIAWRDMGCDQIEIFQIGETGLKIMGKDSPIVVEVEEGMPYIQSNVSDPRFLAAFYKFVRGVNASPSHDCTERETNGMSHIGDSTVCHHAHGSESRIKPIERMERFGRRTSHDQTCPAAGIGPKVTVKFKVIVRPKPAPKRSKLKSQTVILTA